MNRPTPIAAITSAIAGFSLPAAALAETPLGKDTQLSFGVFITDQDTNTKLQSNVGEDTDLDFEDDLGLDSSTSVFRFDGYHRFGEKSRISASIFDLSRDATVDIAGEIRWQDTVFPITARIATDLDFTIYKLSYGYEFLQRDNAYMAASIGLYTADIAIALENLVTDDIEAEDVTAPLPVFGLSGGYALSDRWTTYAGAEVFAANFDDIDGLLYDVSAGIDYWISDRVAVGLAYNYVEIDVDARSEDLNADLEWSYSGVLLALKVGF